MEINLSDLAVSTPLYLSVLLVFAIVFGVVAAVLIICYYSVSLDRDEKDTLLKQKRLVASSLVSVFLSLGILGVIFMSDDFRNPAEAAKGNFISEVEKVYGLEIAENVEGRKVSRDLNNDSLKVSYVAIENFVQDGLLGTVMLEVDRNAMAGELVFYPQSGESKGTPVPTLK